MIDSKFTDKEAREEVSRITHVTLTGRMYAKVEDYMKLTRVRETLEYLRNSDFFNKVTKN